ncbi:MAG: methylated-DNA--[protein]-cysteine S-methyltransferase [Kineosporiaceae bacterium]
MDVWRPLDSPVGVLLLTATDGPGDGLSGGALTGIYFQDHRGGADARVTTDRLGQRDEDHPVLVAAAGQLAEYFEGTRTEFDLPLAAVGTVFQRRVWDALLEIPYGRTASYGDIARRLGLGPAASRAVGLANGANPISIVVPCHRVIGANGTLTGYGGGLERKQFLLDLEGDQLF